MTEALLAWPDYVVPAPPLNDQIQHTPPDRTQRQVFEQGMARQRPAFRATPSGGQYQWAMTQAQYRIFRGFLRVLAGARFTVPMFSGSDYTTVTAQFVKGSLKAAPSGGEWLVSGQIQTMDNLAAAGSFESVWPESLPQQTLNDPYAQTLPDNVNQADFDLGMPDQAAPFRNVAQTLSCQWAMTAAQFETFKSFFAAMAGRRFAMPVFQDAEYVTATVQFVTGSVQTTRSGDDWIVAGQVETMDSLALDEDDYIEALLLYGSDETIDDMLGRFHTAVQVGFFAVGAP